MKLAKLAFIAAATLISTSAFAANLNVKCYKGLIFSNSTLPIVSFEIANNKSNRLMSDINESRSSSDNEVFPAYLVSQYKYQPLEILVEIDDGSSDDNVVATLQGLYAGKKSGEKARYLGAYQRHDAGRKLSTVVTCVVK